MNPKSDSFRTMTLKRFLEENKLTATELARRCGVPQNTLSRFLTGENMLSPKNIRKILKYTGDDVSFADLMREGDKLKDAQP